MAGNGVMGWCRERGRNGVGDAVKNRVDWGMEQEMCLILQTWMFVVVRTCLVKRR